MVDPGSMPADEQVPADATADPAAASPPETKRRPQVVIVTGPTAVGKTAISLLLAQRLRQPVEAINEKVEAEAEGQGRGGAAAATAGADGCSAGVGGADGCSGGRGEVISADSVQVYRGLDVGSDKLPPPQRLGVPHHLIDVRDPSEDFSAGEFFECARPVAEDIVRRGGVPLVVGGTGLYLRWFVVGKGGAPRATPEAQAAVEAAMAAAWAEAATAKCAAAGGEAAAAAGAPPAEVEAAAEAAAGPAGGGGLTDDEKWEAAAALLSKWGDEVAYGRIRAERNNYYRLERALCILAMNPGAKLSDFEPRADPDQELEYDFRCFFLHRPRVQLYDRIAARVEEMVVGGGLLEEAAMLLRAGIAPGQNMAAKAIGYRQAMEWLVAAKAAGRPVGLADLCALHAAICQATHKLVRAQMTWFRDDPMYKWIDVEGRDPRDVAEEILAEVAKPKHEGGCGDSGRLSKEEQKAIMRYKPQLKLLTEANAIAAKKVAEAAAAAAAAAAALTEPPPPPPQQQEQQQQQQQQQKPPSRPPRPKSKAALAAEAAAAAAAAAEAELAPLLTRINKELLPGIPETAVAAAAAVAAGSAAAEEEGNAGGPGGARGSAAAAPTTAGAAAAAVEDAAVVAAATAGATAAGATAVSGDEREAKRARSD